jgi:hypothetical protein
MSIRGIAVDGVDGELDTISYDQLPELAKLNMLVAVDPKDLLQLCSTNKSFSGICNDPSNQLWFERLEKDCPQYKMLEKYGYKNDTTKENVKGRWKDCVGNRNKIYYDFEDDIKLDERTTREMVTIATHTKNNVHNISAQFRAASENGHLPLMKYLYNLMPKESRQPMVFSTELGGPPEITKWLFTVFDFDDRQIADGIIKALHNGNIETAELIIKTKNLSNDDVSNIFHDIETNHLAVLPVVSIKWLFEHGVSSENFRFSPQFIYYALLNGSVDQLRYIHQIFNIRNIIVDTLGQYRNNIEIYNASRESSYHQMMEWIRDEFGIEMTYRFMDRMNRIGTLGWVGDKIEFKPIKMEPRYGGGLFGY